MRLLISTVAALALLAGFAHGHSGGLDAWGGGQKHGRVGCIQYGASLACSAVYFLDASR